MWAVPEGTPVFPGEPLVTVAGPMVQAQFVETMVLLTINHQTLIATKASRITRAAQRPHGAGVRLAPGAGLRRRDLRRARGVHRRLPGHGVRAGRPRLQDPGGRHDGALLGADVRLASTRRSRPTPRSTRTTASSWWIPIMCSSRGVPNAIRVARRGGGGHGRAPQGHPPGLGRHCVPVHRGARDAGRGGLSRTCRSWRPTRWTNTWCATCS